MANKRFNYFLVLVTAFYIRSCLLQDSSSKQTVYCLFNYDIECNSTCSIYGFEVGHCSKGRCVCHGDLHSKHDQLLVLSGTSIVTSTAENLKLTETSQINPPHHDKTSNVAHLHDQLRKLGVNPLDIINGTDHHTVTGHHSEKHNFEESFQRTSKKFVKLVETLRHLVEAVVKFFTNSTDSHIMRHSDEEFATFHINSNEAPIPLPLLYSTQVKDFYSSTRDSLVSRAPSPLLKESVEEQYEAWDGIGGVASASAEDVADASAGEDHHLETEGTTPSTGHQSLVKSNNTSHKVNSSSQTKEYEKVTMVPLRVHEDSLNTTKNVSAVTDVDGLLRKDPIEAIASALSDENRGKIVSELLDKDLFSEDERGFLITETSISKATVHHKGYITESSFIPESWHLNMSSSEFPVDETAGEDQKSVRLSSASLGTSKGFTDPQLGTTVSSVVSSASKHHTDLIPESTLIPDAWAFNLSSSESLVDETTSKDPELESPSTDLSGIQKGITDPELETIMPFMVPSISEHPEHHKDLGAATSVIPDLREPNVSSSESPVVETGNEDEESEESSTNSSGIQKDFIYSQLSTTVSPIPGQRGHHKDRIPESSVVSRLETPDVNQDQESEDFSSESSLSTSNHTVQEHESDILSSSTQDVLEDVVHQPQLNTSSSLSSVTHKESVHQEGAKAFGTESSMSHSKEGGMSMSKSAIHDEATGHQRENQHSFSTVAPHFEEHLVHQGNPAIFKTVSKNRDHQHTSDVLSSESWNSEHGVQTLKSSSNHRKFKNLSMAVNSSGLNSESHEEEGGFNPLDPISVEDFSSEENLKPNFSNIPRVAQVGTGTTATSHHLQRIITVLISNLNNGSASETNRSSVHSGSSVSTLKYLIVLLTQRLKDLDDPSSGGGGGDLKVDKDQGFMDDLSAKEIKDLIVLLQKRVEILEKKIHNNGTEQTESSEDDSESLESYEDVTSDYEFYSDDGLLESVRSSVDVIIRNYIAKQKAAAAAKRTKNVRKKIKKPKHKHLDVITTETGS